MTLVTAFVRIWKNSGRPGRCKFCAQRLVWGISDEGKRTPLNASAKPIRTDRDARTGATFDVFAVGDCHFRTCTKSPPRRRSSAPAGQSRLL